MAIKKKLIHFNSFEDFNSKKLSANAKDTQYTLGVDGEVMEGMPDILFRSIVFIKDVKKIWTHGEVYNCSSSESVDWDDVKNKPESFVPSAHNHSTSDVSGLEEAISGKYTKPTDGIPYEDLNKVLKSILDNAVIDDDYEKGERYVRTLKGWEKLGNEVEIADIVEDGFYIVDENYNIACKIEESGNIIGCGLVNLVEV